MSEVTIVEMKPQVVIGMRKRGKHKDLGVMIPALFKFAADKGIEVNGSPVFICREKSEEEAMEAEKTGNVDLEAALPVASKIEGAEEITCYELPGGTMAKIVNKGPYDKCEDAFNKLFAWIEKNKKEVVGPLREVYINNPHEVQPEDIITEILAPIK